MLKEKLWISWSEISESIIEVNVRIPGPGFTKILLNVTKEEFPDVTLLPSGIVWAMIEIPGLLFKIWKVPRTKPLLVFIFRYLYNPLGVLPGS